MINKKVNVFYHLYVVDNCDYLIFDQLNKLSILKDKLSNIDIFINVSKQHENDVIPQELMIQVSNLTTNIFFSNNDFEFPTLTLLKDHANKTNDEYYLYLHTKGITRMHGQENGRYSPKNVENWRKIMEHFCIENYDLCLKNLENYDLVGCNYIPVRGVDGLPAHYSGNFWWSKSEFLKKLPEINELHTSNLGRFSAEMWIGTICHKALCLYPIPKPIQENHNRCFVFTEEKDFMNNPIPQEFQNCD